MIKLGKTTEDEDGKCHYCNSGADLYKLQNRHKRSNIICEACMTELFEKFNELNSIGEKTVDPDREKYKRC